MAQVVAVVAAQRQRKRPVVTLGVGSLGLVAADLDWVGQRCMTRELSLPHSMRAAALALDEDAGLLIVAFRQPAGLAWFDLTLPAAAAT
jgi:hypothetical protein